MDERKCRAGSRAGKTQTLLKSTPSETINKETLSRSRAAKITQKPTVSMMKGGPPGWEDWYFEHGMLCSPNGDRFTPECILACVYIRQMDAFGIVYDQNSFGWRT